MTVKELLGRHREIYRGNEPLQKPSASPSAPSSPLPHGKDFGVVQQTMGAWEAPFMEDPMLKGWDELPPMKYPTLKEEQEPTAVSRFSLWEDVSHTMDVERRKYSQLRLEGV